MQAIKNGSAVSNLKIIKKINNHYIILCCDLLYSCIISCNKNAVSEIMVNVCRKFKKNSSLLDHSSYLDRHFFKTSKTLCCRHNLHSILVSATKKIEWQLWKQLEKISYILLNVNWYGNISAIFFSRLFFDKIKSIKVTTSQLIILPWYLHLFSTLLKKYASFLLFVQLKSSWNKIFAWFLSLEKKCHDSIFTKNDIEDWTCILVIII